MKLKETEQLNIDSIWENLFPLAIDVFIKWCDEGFTSQFYISPFFYVGKPIINGHDSNEEHRGELVTSVRVPTKTLNKQTLTPWSDVEGFQPKAVAGEKFKMEFTDLNADAGVQDSNPSPWGNVNNTKTEISESEILHSINGNGPVWSVTESSSDWPAVSNGGGGTSEDPSEDANLLWGDVQNGDQKASSSEAADLPMNSADAGKTQASQESSFVNPFSQDSGFVDNFCEMSETDLIFKSGLVDEEFKTICGKYELTNNLFPFFFEKGRQQIKKDR